MSGASRDIASLRVEHDGEQSLLVAPTGTVLRDVLLANGVSPYTKVTKHLNCSGRGLCATCGVRFVDDEPGAGSGIGSSGNEEPAPDHWHDSLAAGFDYPRLSCQIEVERDMHIEIPEKVLWGSRRTDGG